MTGKFIKFVASSGLLYALTGIFLTVGTLSLIAYITRILFPLSFWPTENHLSSTRLLPTAEWCLILSVFTGALALVNLDCTKPAETQPDYSKIMFGRCLVGIGFVLLLDALVNIVAIAGFANSGSVSILSEITDGTSSHSTSIVEKRLSTSTPSAGETNSNPADVKTDNSVTTKSVSETRSRIFQYTQVNLIKAIQLLFALGFTLMGALFFFAKSL